MLINAGEIRRKQTLVPPAAILASRSSCVHRCERGTHVGYFAF
jgi:hypothetical protein